MPLPATREERIAQLRRIFMPRGVAVVGASPTPGKLGNLIVNNLKNAGFTGNIYPVNPNFPEVAGLTCYPSLEAVPGDTDVAVVAIPAPAIAGLAPAAGKKGIAGLVVISSGFAEVGQRALQDELVKAARANNLRILGPNIYGYFYTPLKLCATFAMPYTEPGGVALVSQSGGVANAILGYSRSRRMGVSAIVGLGNKADIDDSDALEFFGQDPNTQVIALHIEGLKDGRAFMETAKRISKVKPVVVLKGGRSSAGAKAASSHTASLAGEDRVYDAAFRQSGLIRARTLEDLLDWSRALQLLPDPAGENVLIVCGAGGLGVLMADACADHGLRLPPLPPDLQQAMKACIPPFGSVNNPIDVTGGEGAETYRKVISLALNDSRVHALVFGYWHTPLAPPLAFAKMLIDLVKEAKGKGIVKPVVVGLAGDVEVEDAVRLLEANGIPAYAYAVEQAIGALAARYRFWRGRRE